MKKLFSLGSLLFCILVVVGCDGSSKEADVIRDRVSTLHVGDPKDKVIEFLEKNHWAYKYAALDKKFIIKIPISGDIETTAHFVSVDIVIQSDDKIGLIKIYEMHKPSL